MNEGLAIKKKIKEEDLSMYSTSRKKPRKKTESIPKVEVQSPNKKTVAINVDGKTINVPSVEHVNALEKENQEMRRRIERLHSVFSRLSIELEKLKRYQQQIMINNA